MKIRIDVNLCEGHAQCEDAAPEVFRVNDDAIVELLIASPDESLRPQVEEAARRCPVDAIVVE